MDDHATRIEGAIRDALVLRGEALQSIADDAQKIQAERVIAEANVAAVLGRIDQILGELKIDDRQLKEAMDAKDTAIRRPLVGCTRSFRRALITRCRQEPP